MQIHATLVAGTASRLVTAGLFGGNVKTDRTQPSADSELPIAIVHVSGDVATAIGDARTGPPKFDHQTTLTVDLYVRDVSGPAAKGAIYTAAEVVLQTLLADATWLAIAGGICVQRITQQDIMPDEGAYAFSGRRIELVVLHATSWDADIADDLSSVSVGIEMDNGDDTPQITTVVTVPTA